MHTISVETINQRLAMYFGQDSYQIENLDTLSSTASEAVLICPIHGKTTKALRLIVDGRGCSKCAPFRGSLSRMYGRKASEETMRKLYAYAWQHQKELMKLHVEDRSDYDKAMLVYNWLIRDDKTYQRPPLLDTSVVKTRPAFVTGSRTPAQALADINAVWQDSFTFPFIEQEFKDTLSHITAVCPIHGSFSTTFSQLVHNKGGCGLCRSTRIGFCRIFGKEAALGKMIEMYADLRREKALIEADQANHPTATLLHIRNKNNQTEEKDMSVVRSEQDASVTNDNQPNPTKSYEADQATARILRPHMTDEPPFEIFRKSTNGMTKGYGLEELFKLECRRLIDLFVQLDVDQVSTVNITGDFMNNTQVTTLTLKDGTKITVEDKEP